MYKEENVTIASLFPFERKVRYDVCSNKRNFYNPKVFKVDSKYLGRNIEEYHLTLLPNEAIHYYIPGHTSGIVLLGVPDLLDIYNNDGGKDILGDIWTINKEKLT